VVAQGTNVEPDDYRLSWLLPGHNFAIEYTRGWLVGTVREHEPVLDFTYNRLDRQTAGSNDASIATVAVDNNPWFEVVTANASKPLYEQRAGVMLQTFVGVGIHGLYKMWYTYPDPTPHGSLQDIAAGGSPNDTTPGFVRATDSPLGSPTSRGEIMIPRHMTVKFAMRNGSVYSSVPVLRFLINRFRAKFYDAANTTDRAIIERMLTAQKDRTPVHVWRAGFVSPPNFAADEEYEVTLYDPAKFGKEVVV